MRKPPAAPLRYLLAIALGALASACAPAGPARPAVDPARLLAEARREGLPATDPLALDGQIKASVEAFVRGASSPEERLRLLQDYLSLRVKFEYASSRSLTAREAWRERHGDCMAYTNLFVALSRHVGLETYFVHVREVRDFYERGGSFFVSSHVAAGHGSGPTARIIDFSKELSVWREMGDWRLAAYKAIGDGDAIALYYNNIAVDQMLQGKMDRAERIFRFWLARAPGMAELGNNLGVLLNRQGRDREALAVLARAIDAFPAFKPLYTNGIHAARGAGRADVAADLARRGHALQHDDPFFIFAQALNLYQDGAYAEAAGELRRAHAAKPDSPVILAWRTRACLLAGQAEEARAAFAALRRLAPRGAFVRDLVAQFPELRPGITDPSGGSDRRGAGPPRPTLR